MGLALRNAKWTGGCTFTGAPGLCAGVGRANGSCSRRPFAVLSGELGGGAILFAPVPFELIACFPECGKPDALTPELFRLDRVGSFGGTGGSKGGVGVMTPVLCG